MDWYVLVGEDRRGPVSEADLGNMVASGELKPDSLVWNESMDDWKKASENQALTALLPALKPRKEPPPPPRQEKKTPPPPPRGNPTGATGATTNWKEGEMHWLAKAGQSLGTGTGAKPEDLKPSTALGFARLELFGACMVLILINLGGVSFNWTVAPFSGMVLITTVITFVICGLLWLGAVNLFKGDDAMAKVMMFVNMGFGGLGALLSLASMVVVPLIGLFALILSAAQVFVAILGFQSSTRLDKLKG